MIKLIFIIKPEPPQERSLLVCTGYRVVVSLQHVNGIDVHNKLYLTLVGNFKIFRCTTNGFAQVIRVDGLQ